MLVNGISWARLKVGAGKVTETIEEQCASGLKIVRHRQQRCGDQTYLTE
jgi:hypothetical protein